MARRHTLESIIEKSNKIHDFKYDYSLIKEYNGVMELYPVICPTHGVWNVTFDNHTAKKSGCPKCKGHKLTKQEKIDIANRIHDFKYDYSLIKENKIMSYSNYNIRCKKCSHIFNNSWDNHTHKSQGCPKCNKAGRKKRTIESIKKQILSLDTGYQYNWESFKGYYDGNFKIKCEQHGWFKQSVANHIFGQRCPKCKRSKGEDAIEKFLIENNIEYETQKRFDNCKSKRSLPFDFYIPSKNLLIEYDGELHYRPVEYFGGIEHLKLTQKHDKIKNEFCKKNKINLIRISYLDFNDISSILGNITHANE